MRKILDMKNQLRKLDDGIRTKFIPAIRGGINCSDNERKLMPFPPRFGGLAIPIFSGCAQKEYEFSTILSKDLTKKQLINKHNFQPATMQKR